MMSFTTCCALLKLASSNRVGGVISTLCIYMRHQQHRVNTTIDLCICSYTTAQGMIPQITLKAPRGGTLLLMLALKPPAASRGRSIQPHSVLRSSGTR